MLHVPVRLSLDYTDSIYQGGTREYRLVLNCVECGLGIDYKASLTTPSGLLWHPDTYTEKEIVNQKTGTYRDVRRKSACTYAGVFVEPPVIELKERKV